MNKDCDNGKRIMERIKDLELLLQAYRDGVIHDMMISDN